ncbi:unnamed protein product [Sphagnum jensenii]|uniref:Xrn1 helical domain-containing protein n=1 Tax=Sphagnum jensenii TaxID=128206 RepID=A0ABP0V8J2_9BRYO
MSANAAPSASPSIALSTSDKIATGISTKTIDVAPYNIPTDLKSVAATVDDNNEHDNPQKRTRPTYNITNVVESKNEDFGHAAVENTTTSNSTESGSSDGDMAVIEDSEEKSVDVEEEEQHILIPSIDKILYTILVPNKSEDATINASNLGPRKVLTKEEIKERVKAKENELIESTRRLAKTILDCTRQDGSPASAHALPVCCQWLMLDAARSPIIDLYDSDIELDSNGKHLPWLWVLLLPFIDERRVVQAYRLCEGLLTRFERKRNIENGNFLFVHQEHVLARDILGRQYKYSSMGENSEGVESAILEVNSLQVDSVELNDEMTPEPGHGHSPPTAPLLSLFMLQPAKAYQVYYNLLLPNGTHHSMPLYQPQNFL